MTLALVDPTAITTTTAAPALMAELRARFSALATSEIPDAVRSLASRLTAEQQKAAAAWLAATLS